MPTGPLGVAAQSQTAPHIARWIAAAIESAPGGHVPLLFLSGAQGSGKSTALAQALAAMPMPVAGASIDDFYLPFAARLALARDRSPLFAVRGPPGTHDLDLLNVVIARLRSARTGSETSLPVFDKLADDRVAPENWRRFSGRPAAIVIEGWLMGALPGLSQEDLPLNPVEAEDIGGIWRAHQEAALANGYARLWDIADGFFHLVAPGFETVTHWRLEQEAALWAARGETMPDERRAWVGRFVQHYERITRRMLAGQTRPGTRLPLDDRRRIRPTYSS